MTGLHLGGQMAYPTIQSKVDCHFLKLDGFIIFKIRLTKTGMNKSMISHNVITPFRPCLKMSLPSSFSEIIFGSTWEPARTNKWANYQRGVKAGNMARFT